MSLLSMWAHGNAFTVSDRPGEMQNVPPDGGPERPWTDIVGLHRGEGTEFRGKRNTVAWFHVSIPTLVMMPFPTNPGVRSIINKINILFWAKPNVFLQHVFLFDGKREIFSRRLITDMRPNGVDGRHDEGIELEVNAWRVNEQPIYWGIGMSVQINFKTDDIIRFTGAGAEFKVFE